jgi:hypothetical protein
MNEITERTLLGKHHITLGDAVEMYGEHWSRKWADTFRALIEAGFLVRVEGEDRLIGHWETRKLDD